MSTQSNQGKKPDEDSYAGYSGYKPRKPAEDPYGAYYQPSGSQRGGTTGADSQQTASNSSSGQQQQQKQSYRSSGQQQQQQSSTYQPPSSVTGRRSGSSSRASRRLQSNHAAALSYLGVFLTGIFFLFWGRNDRLVRFSAAQSIVLFLPLFIIYSILQFVIGIIGAIWIIGPLLAFFLGAVVLVLVLVPGALLWFYLMLQALRGIEVKLPIVGEYAEWLAGFVSPRQKKAKN